MHILVLLARCLKINAYFSIAGQMPYTDVLLLLLLLSLCPFYVACILIFKDI